MKVNQFIWQLALHMFFLNTHPHSDHFLVVSFANNPQRCVKIVIDPLYL